MRNRILSPRVVPIAVACAAVVFLTQCNKSSTAPKQVAASNITVATTASTVAAVSATPLSFPAGGAVLAPALANQSFTMTLNTSGSATTAAIALPGINGNVQANVTFGSCIFTVSVSNVASLPVGSVVTISPCTINAATGGAQTDTQTNVPVTMTLGSATSSQVSLPVTVSATGGVTIGTTNVGTVTLTNGTGG